MSKINFADKAYQTIKQDIITYRLKPGSALTFDKLSHSLNMSQTPIREALSRLWQEQFVVRQDAKGYVVSSLDAKQVEELYDLRIILEVPAMRQTICNLDDACLRELKDTLNMVAQLIEEERRGKIIEYELKFHATILKYSGNKLLSEIGETVLDRVYRVQNLNILTSDRLFVAHKQHEELFELIQAGNEAACADFMADHLASAKGYVLARLNDDDDILCKLLT